MAMWALTPIFLLTFVPHGRAAEGGYSNYISGTYGDFGVALEPAEKFTIRNDLYLYSADTTQTVRNGQPQVGLYLLFNQ
jgi:hypothetical protein